VAVCGDLNDTSDAATTQLLFGPPGSQYGTGGYRTADHGDGQRLWDTGYAMTPPNNYSRITEGRRELIDHILASHALMRTFRDTATVDFDVPSVGAVPRTAPRVDPPSDHRPVLAHFDIPKPGLTTSARRNRDGKGSPAYGCPVPLFGVIEMQDWLMRPVIMRPDQGCRPTPSATP
jgi:hypothetical protein